MIHEPGDFAFGVSGFGPSGFQGPRFGGLEVYQSSLSIAIQQP